MRDLQAKADAIKAEYERVYAESQTSYKRAYTRIRILLAVGYWSQVALGVAGIIMVGYIVYALVEVSP